MNKRKINVVVYFIDIFEGVAENAKRWRMTHSSGFGQECELITGTRKTKAGKIR